MAVYVLNYRRDAYETIYVEAEDIKEAHKIADQKQGEINWENADYEVDCIDVWIASGEEEEEYGKSVKSQLRGFN